ncbi:TetR family transcriptional regulator [Nocardia sp. NPDC020380]|uniref:TetR family transcriptional regulator n=1 Tax=Nocardia sp. NPDC020380 TaxID=3364309 RepID=UPI0037B340DF
MARWEPNALGRLEQAALELYRENGFDSTTVAQIAERAGLTERTFFRYFTDKREVLFGGTQPLRELLVNGVAAAPEGTAPLAAVLAALEHAADELFEPRRALALQRQLVIDANPGLQERELVKSASLGVALAEALRERGVPETVAELAGQVGIAVLHTAFGRWTRDTGEQTLAQLLRDTAAQLPAIELNPVAGG